MKLASLSKQQPPHDRQFWKEKFEREKARAEHLETVVAGQARALRERAQTENRYRRALLICAEDSCHCGASKVAARALAEE